jgi:class 3 adenylate cyclase
VDSAAWIGVAAACVGSAAVVLGWAKFVVEAPLRTKLASLELKLDTGEADRKTIAEELDREKAHSGELTAALSGLQQDFYSFKVGKPGIVLKTEIDADLVSAMDVIGVGEASILVPGPPAGSRTLVFLSIFGPAAPRLKKTRLPMDRGIAGRVFDTGTPNNTSNPRGDQSFFEGIDMKGGGQTRALLTVPIQLEGKTLGVLQFLNKPQGFTNEDETRSTEVARLVAPKIGRFLLDPENFESLGLAWKDDARIETIVFCDLTSSSSLLASMNAASAVDCFNEYLESHCDVAMRHGGTIDAYLGDGALFRFGRPRAAGLKSPSLRALEASLTMIESFEHLKESWLLAGLPVEPLHTRIGVATGPVYEAMMGHPQLQRVTVIGQTVNLAARLCESAPRDRSVLLVDGRTETDGLEVTVAMQPHTLDDGINAFDVHAV